MEPNDINAWQAAESASELFSPLPKDAEPGTQFADGDRLWLRVQIHHGSIAGRWAYWLVAKLHERDSFEVVADTIFNPNAHHFIGLLEVPFVPPRLGEVSLAWVLLEPRMKSSPKYIYKDAIEPQTERYERSKEVYDVETKKLSTLE